MREIRLSGSEGGAERSSVSTPYQPARRQRSVAATPPTNQRPAARRLGGLMTAVAYSD
jgi:hypothetical protein